jgi:FixJ family two-component response regulator
MAGRKCTVCAHAKAQEINKAIVRGDSYRAISSRFGVSRAAAMRHRKHLAAQLFKLEEAKKLADARSLLEEIGRAHV